MRLRDRRDDGDVRTGQSGKRRNLTRMVHSDLGHTEFGVARNAGKGERKSPVVVVRRNRCVNRAERRERRAQHFLGRGLADAAGDSDKFCRRIGLAEPGAGETAQTSERGQRIVDLDRGLARRDRSVHHRSRGTLCQRVGDKGVAITAFADQRDEEVAAGQGARIDRYARGVEADGERAARRLAQLSRCPQRRGQAIAPHPAVRPRTMAASSNGSTAPPMIWPCS